MPAPPTRQLRVVRYAAGWGYAAREWEAALGAVDWTAAPEAGGPRRLKIRRRPAAPDQLDHDCTVWLAALALPGREATVVLKVEPLAHWRAVLRSWLGFTKAHRQWRGANTLAARGFEAARGLALLRGNTAVGPADLLVLEAYPGKTILQHLADDDLTPRQQHALASAAGRHALRMARAGIVNRDSKPSNLLVRAGGRGPELVVLDTVAIARRPPAIARRQVPRMLRDLVLEPLGCGLSIRRTLLMRAICASTPGAGANRKSLRNAAWRRVEALVAAHGDPTPTDDPLAR